MNPVQLCNAALGLLGSERVERISLSAEEIEDGLELEDLESTCADVYPLIRNELVAGYPWSWLIRRERLAAAPAVSGEQQPYRYKWTLPALDQGAIRAVYASGEQDAAAQVRGWTRLGPFLYTEFPNSWIEYQTDVDEAAWPTLFTTAVVLQLTADLAPGRVYDAQIARGWQNRANTALKEAKRLDGQGTPTKQVQYFGYVEARLRSGISGDRFGRSSFDWSNPNPP